MSRNMKIFISILTTIFLGCYLAAAIVLYNSNYKLLNYIDEFPLSDYWNWDFDFDDSFNFNDNREVSIDDTVSTIRINTSSTDIIMDYTESPNVNINLQCRSRNNITFDEIVNNYSVNNNTLFISTNNNFTNIKRSKITISIPRKYKNNI